MMQPRGPVGRAQEPDALENVLALAKRWWGEHGRIVLVLSVVVLGALLGYNAYRNKRERDERASWEALSRLPSPAYLLTLSQEQSEQERAGIIKECEDILDSRPRTAATPWVLLKLANAHCRSGHLSEAERFCRRVLENYPRSGAARMARSVLAAVLEDAGRHSEAAELFERLATRRAGEPLCWLDAARNRELAGQVELARKDYRAFVEAGTEEHPQLLALARHRLKSLDEGQLLSVPPAPEPAGEPEGAEGQGEGGPGLMPEQGLSTEGTLPDKDVEAAPDGER